jgi:cysteinyl-tRNA synthetase
MRLSDTLTKAKVELPEGGPIRMYFCGPTVYQRAHIGNARPFVLGMWLRNWLRVQGRDVRLVHNITDINDRIYEAAPGASAALAERATAWYLEDTAALGLGRPDELPKASDFVAQIIRFISELIDRGYAYEVEGDVYFRVARDPKYGRLSGQRPEQVEEQEPNRRKEDPRDFALWKANKPDEDTSWDSPWGRGRPGWHIECSVMAEELLGPVFEIHGGGLDLVFPHHENELAQSGALGHDLRAHLDAQRLTALHRLEDVEVGGEHRHDPRCRRALGSRSDPRLLHDRPLVEADRLLGGGHGVGGGTCRSHSRGLPRRIPARGRLEPVRGGARGRLQHARSAAVLHGWRDHDLLRRALDIFGLASLAEAADAPPEIVELAERRRQARTGARLRRSRPVAGRDRSAGWEARDVADGFQLVPK